MQHILAKVYAGLYPAGAVRADSVSRAGEGAMHADGAPWLFHKGDLLRIGFESVNFSA